MPGIPVLAMKELPDHGNLRPEPIRCSKEVILAVTGEAVKGGRQSVARKEIEQKMDALA
jgi:hypothetical protein